MNADKPTDFTHYALTSHMLLTNQQLQLLSKNILCPDEEEKLGAKFKCPLCGMTTDVISHFETCRKLNGLHKKHHNIICNKIMTLFPKKLEARACSTIRYEFARNPNDIETKKQPDIIIKDGHTFDYTCSVNPNEMYKTKQKKYNPELEIDVIPIVTTPDFKMHPESVKSMK